MPRTRNTPSTPSFAVIAPPPRKRKLKTAVPGEILDALADAITDQDWIGDASMFFPGDDGQKDSSTEARVYRRDLSRHMGIAERNVRTRVWETEDGWQFALRLREGVVKPNTESGTSGDADGDAA